MLIICHIDWSEVGVAVELQCLRNCTLSSYNYCLKQKKKGKLPKLFCAVYLLCTITSTVVWVNVLLGPVCFRVIFVWFFCLYFRLVDVSLVVSTNAISCLETNDLLCAARDVKLYSLTDWVALFTDRQTNRPRLEQCPVVVRRGLTLLHRPLHASPPPLRLPLKSHDIHNISMSHCRLRVKLRQFENNTKKYKNTGILADAVSEISDYRFWHIDFFLRIVGWTFLIVELLKEYTWLSTREIS